MAIELHRLMDAAPVARGRRAHWSRVVPDSAGPRRSLTALPSPHDTRFDLTRELGRGRVDRRPRASWLRACSDRPTAPARGRSQPLAVAEPRRVRRRPDRRHHDWVTAVAIASEPVFVGNAAPSFPTGLARPPPRIRRPPSTRCTPSSRTTKRARGEPFRLQARARGPRTRQTSPGSPTPRAVRALRTSYLRPEMGGQLAHRLAPPPPRCGRPLLRGDRPGRRRGDYVRVRM
jgi:hypothetical protein